MKSSASLNGLIRNESKSSGVGAEILMRNYMVGRFLARVAMSDYRKNFVIKGGMLISILVGSASRTTHDLDATIKGKTLSSEDVKTMINAITSQPVNDNIAFTCVGISEIREQDDYPGFRASLVANFDKIKQPVKLDFTTGDMITPRAIEFEYPLMFDEGVLEIMAYNVETVLAEKFEAIVKLGTLGTRMRDYYDIYILTKTQPFNETTFRTALSRTAKKRGSSDDIAKRYEVIKAIESSESLREHWKNYQKKVGYADSITFDMTIEAIMQLANLISE